MSGAVVVVGVPLHDLAIHVEVCPFYFLFTFFPAECIKKERIYFNFLAVNLLLLCLADLIEFRT